MRIYKQDAFSMSGAQASAGRQWWKKTGQVGRLASSTFDAEAMAPKTWILYANKRGEEISTIECELYTAGRFTDPGEGVVMVVGMCPKCGEHFTAREDNKTLNIDYVSYRQAPPFLRVNWDYHLRQTGRRRSDDDKIPVISSPERWACDYCKEWCVKVYDGIAKDHHKGVTQIVVHGNIPILKAPPSSVDL